MQTIDGGFITAGQSRFNDGDVSGNNGALDFWLVKLNSIGVIQWQKSLGGSRSEIARSVKQTSDGGYIVCGETKSDNGDVGFSYNTDTWDAWVVKLNSVGNIEWSKVIGGVGHDYLRSIQQTSDGGYVAAGGSTSANGETNNEWGNYDYWVLKLDNLGNIQWEKTFGIDQFDFARSISKTSDGGYILNGITSTYNGAISVSSDFWIIKLDSSGNIQWEKILGGSSYESGFFIKQTMDGGYIGAGNSTSTDGDITGNNGSGDYWVVKLDNSGNLQWQKNLGGSNFDSANSIQQTTDGDYIVSGFTSSNDGDVIGNHGGNDFWILKLNAFGNVQWKKSLGGSENDYAQSFWQTADRGGIIIGFSRSDDGDVTDNNGDSDMWVVKLSCLNSIPDLYIKDSPEDSGIEPNSITENMWTSEDIWIRNNDDNGLIHQNPEYRSNNQPNFIYIRVINNSCVASNGNEILSLNWAKANTALAWPQNWDGSLQNTNGYDLGGTLPAVSIPIIQPDEEAIVKIPWVIPNPDNYLDNDNPWHFCLIGRIDSSIDILSQPYTTNPNIMVRNNNNQAWKNITIVDLLEDRGIGGVVGVGNIYNQTKKYKLTFALDNDETGKPLFEEAEITVEMDDVLYQIWEAGEKVGNNIKPTKEPNKIVITGNDAFIGNLSFKPEDIGKLYLKFNFLTKELTNKNVYVYHVIQRDEDNNDVIGGETYVVDKAGSRSAFYADAGGTKEINENEPITITATNISEPAIYNWYDEEGNLIYEGKDLNVTTDITKKYKLEVIALSDGFKDYTEIEVKIKPSIIENINPNPASNNVNIEYKVNGSSSAYLMIIGYYGSNTSNNYILDVNSNNVVLDISNYPMGHYNVALVCDGEIVDAKTLIKQ